MGKYKRLLSNTAILGAGTFTSKVLVFLLMPLYTAYLTTEQFGTADVLMQTANLLMPLAALGICDGLFRFALDSAGERRKQVFSTALLVIAVGVIPLSLVIQLFRLVDIYNGYVWLVLLYVCMANLHSVCANYIRACGKTAAFAIQGIANTILTITLNVIFLVVLDMGVLGYVLSVAVSDLVITVGIFIFCRLYKDISFKRGEKGLLGAMLKFSIPYIPTTLMWTITSACDRFVVTGFCGADANGLYAAAYKLPTIISIAGGVFIEAWQFSTVSDAKPEERSKFFEMVHKNYMGIMFIGTSALVALSKIFTMLLLNEAYYSSWKYVPVLGMAMLFSAFSAFMGSIYFLEKRSMRSFVTAGIGAAVNVVLNFVLIIPLGAMGAAIATVISYLAVYVIRVFDTKKYLPFKLSGVRVIINSILLLVQIVIMVFEAPYWMLWQIALVILIAVINGREIVQTVLQILRKFLKKQK